MRPLQISPSMLAADFTQLGSELSRVESADLLHVDVMDGHFVPNISFGPPVVKSVARHTNLPLDIHLMVEQPELFIPEFANYKPKFITVHYEACRHLHRVLSMIKERGIKSGVAFNPHTPVVGLEPMLPYIDLILIMTVNPGFGGQQLIPEMYDKINNVRHLIKGYDIDIQVDGGVSLDNAAKLYQAGANILVAGSAVFGATDASHYIQALRTSSE